MNDSIWGHEIRTFYWESFDRWVTVVDGRLKESTPDAEAAKANHRQWCAYYGKEQMEMVW